MSSRSSNSDKSTSPSGSTLKAKFHDSGQDFGVQAKRQKEGSTASRKSPPGKGKNSDTAVKAVARIPNSREDSSSNWKALLKLQGKPEPAKSGSSASTTTTPLAAPSRSNNMALQDSTGAHKTLMSVTSRSQSAEPRPASQLSSISSTSDQWNSFGADGGTEGNRTTDSVRVKREFRALGLAGPSQPKSKQPQRQLRSKDSRRGPPSPLIKKPPPGGLNGLGYFDYTHYGVLKTEINQSHYEFMMDTPIVAMDCEMVGVGPCNESALARVSIVNMHGFCLYDKFVKPRVEVTDYRTQYSGIRENDLKNAALFQDVVKEVAALLKGRILVGHSLKSDLSVLYLSHPKARIRDTAMFYKKILHGKTPKLKTLVKKLLGVDIQEGEHSSIIDAQAALALYVLNHWEWESSARQSNRGIDVLKETFDEFKRLKSVTGSTAQQLNPDQTAQPPNQQNNNWYGLPDGDSNTAFCSAGPEVVSVNAYPTRMGSSPPIPMCTNAPLPNPFNSGMQSVPITFSSGEEFQPPNFPINEPQNFNPPFVRHSATHVAPPSIPQFFPFHGMNMNALIPVWNPFQFIPNPNKPSSDESSGDEEVSLSSSHVLEGACAWSARDYPLLPEAPTLGFANEVVSLYPENPRNHLESPSGLEGSGLYASSSPLYNFISGSNNYPPVFANLTYPQITPPCTYNPVCGLPPPVGTGGFYYGPNNCMGLPHPAGINSLNFGNCPTTLPFGVNNLNFNQIQFNNQHFHPTVHTWSPIAPSFVPIPVYPTYFAPLYYGNFPVGLPDQLQQFGSVPPPQGTGSNI